jgi:hypothetical protein
VSVHDVALVFDVHVRVTPAVECVYVMVTPEYVSVPPETETVVGTTPATLVLAIGGLMVTKPENAHSPSDGADRAV